MHGLGRRVVLDARHIDDGDVLRHANERAARDAACAVTQADDLTRLEPSHANVMRGILAERHAA
jgi:hypothetical protein